MMQPDRFARCSWTLLLALGSASFCACTEEQSTPSSFDGGSGAAAGSPLAGSASVAGSSNAAQDSDAGAAAGGASGSPPTSDDAGAPGAASASDVSADFNGCTAAAYEDRRSPAASRTIAIATMGLSFTPKCLLIAVGQTVRWEGALSAHPLAPGNQDHPDAGSPDSPILATSTGDSVEFSFDAPGTFPYQCEVHSFGDGKGMAGVVRVAP